MIDIILVCKVAATSYGTRAEDVDADATTTTTPLEGAGAARRIIWTKTREGGVRKDADL